MQLGDVSESWADVAALARDIGYKPTTPVAEGVAKFVEWYLAYYKVGGKKSDQRRGGGDHASLDTVEGTHPYMSPAFPR